jgi:hypothetical protein
MIPAALVLSVVVFVGCFICIVALWLVGEDIYIDWKQNKGRGT